MFAGMLSKSRFNPSTGIADFWQEFRKPNPYRWPILLASVLPIGVLIAYLADDVSYADPPRPEVTYITSFAPDRTDEEIVASNIANQERKDELAAKRAEIEEQKRQMYRELGRATGIDVDAMEEQIAAERAAEGSAKTAAKPAPSEAVADKSE